MRSSISLGLLTIIHSLVATSNAAPQHFQQRSPYSIIPVDGGAAAAAQAGGSPSPITIILTETETITEKSPPTTITIVEHQPKSEWLITKTVTILASKDGEEIEKLHDKETVYLTVEHVPTAINTEAGGPLIYVPTTVVETMFVTLPAETVWLVGSMSATSDVLSTSTHSFLSSLTSSSTTGLASSTDTASFPTSSFPTQTTAATHHILTSVTLSFTEESTSLSSSESSVTTPPYDDGQWKTTYPVWSNSTPTNTLKPFEP